MSTSDFKDIEGVLQSMFTKVPFAIPLPSLIFIKPDEVVDVVCVSE